MRVCIPSSIKNTFKDKKGYALLVTFTLIIIFTILCFSLLSVLISEVNYVSNRNGKTKADYMAQSAIGHVSATLAASYDTTQFDTQQTFTVVSDPVGETLAYSIQRDSTVRTKFRISGTYSYGGEVKYRTDITVSIDKQNNITVYR